jgi:hypothetical protein
MLTSFTSQATWPPPQRENRLESTLRPRTPNLAAVPSTAAQLPRALAQRARFWWCCSGSTTLPKFSLLGAEFTKVWAGLQGSPEALAAGARLPEAEATAPATTARSPLLRLAALGTVVMAALRHRR